MSKKNSQFTWSANPVVTMSRSKLPGLSYDKHMSANLGTIYPCYIEHVLPGDSFKVSTKVMSRVTSSFVKPAFANIFLDFFYFFVPCRLLYDGWEEIFGENKTGFWSNPDPKEIPQIIADFRASATENKIVTGSVADYLGLPISKFPENEAPKEVQVLPFRAFAKVYDDWFRDENYIQPMAISTGELSSLSDEVFNDQPWSSVNYTGMLPKASKMHDMFSSILPSPQKGNAIEIISSNPNAFLPLVAGSSLSDLGGYMRFNKGDNTNGFMDLQISNSSQAPFKSNVLYGVFDSTPVNSKPASVAVTATNLGVANPLSGALNVNDLRLAFQLQRVLERDARGGTRYIEMLKSSFGVSSPDARLQRSEFLGGKRLSIGISQVAQTTGSDDKTLGSLGGYSLSGGTTGFNKAFVEHGIIIGCCVYRQFHSYQSSISRHWFAKDRYSMYDPALANIGEQPVYAKELYANAPDDRILGFLPAWYHYRYHNNEVCGQMRSEALNTLDMWHIADEYANVPTMNKQFIEETPQFLNRVLSVSSDVQDQFILDLYHDVEAIRVMPVDSVPGLIDHH